MLRHFKPTVQKSSNFRPPTQFQVISDPCNKNRVISRPIIQKPSHCQPTIQKSSHFRPPVQIQVLSDPSYKNQVALNISDFFFITPVLALLHSLSYTPWHHIRSYCATSAFLTSYHVLPFWACAEPQAGDSPPQRSPPGTLYNNTGAGRVKARISFISQTFRPPLDNITELF